MSTITLLLPLVDIYVEKNPRHERGGAMMCFRSFQASFPFLRWGICTNPVQSNLFSQVICDLSFLILHLPEASCHSLLFMWVWRKKLSVYLLTSICRMIMPLKDLLMFRASNQAIQLQNIWSLLSRDFVECEIWSPHRRKLPTNFKIFPTFIPKSRRTNKQKNILETYMRTQCS